MAGTVKTQLLAFVEQMPDWQLRYTLAQLGEQFGVSRQRVHQILGSRRRGEHDPHQRGTSAQLTGLLASAGLDLGPPQPAVDALAQARERLTAFIAANPTAVLQLWEGGMTLKAIQQQLGISKPMLERLWEELRFPPRRRGPPPWRKPRVLGPATCVECGRCFDWTDKYERALANGRRRFVTCSVGCGIRQAAKHRER